MSRELPDMWKVPFRQVYAETFGGWVTECAVCAWLTFLRRLKALLGLPARSATGPK